MSGFAVGGIIWDSFWRGKWLRIGGGGFGTLAADLTLSFSIGQSGGGFSTTNVPGVVPGVIDTIRPFGGGLMQL